MTETVKNFRMMAFAKSCTLCNHFTFEGAVKWRCALGTVIKISKCNPWMAICDTFSPERRIHD